MMFRRAVDWAEKCSLRDLRLDEARPAILLDKNSRLTERGIPYQQRSSWLQESGGSGGIE